MVGLPERVGILESESENHTTKIDELVGMVKSLDENVSKILTEMAKNRGFFHGVIFTLTILGGIIGAFASELWHKIVG